MRVTGWQQPLIQKADSAIIVPRNPLLNFPFVQDDAWEKAEKGLTSCQLFNSNIQIIFCLFKSLLVV